MRKALALILAGGLLVGMLSPAHAKPVSVFTDVTGDAGNQDSGVPGADQAGFDLVGGTIEQKGANLEWTVEHAAMPASGQPGEGFRFLWHFTVDTKGQYRWTFKTVDLGKPDAIAGTGTERVGQVYQNVVRLEECSETPSPAVTLVNCSAIAYYDAVVDPAAKTFTIVSPLKDLKAKKGSVIAGGTHAAGGTSCMVCWVPHYAERSLTPQSVIDSAGIAKEFKVG
ncbi:MAG TPA: hypothetical protein VNP73_05515 [Actinomycetota bacterium]|nr:hypothetical protein [Actinomycetota bacterium]